MAYRTLYFRRDDGTKLNHYYIFDTAAELLGSGLIQGDIAYTVDTGAFYIASSSSTWAAVTGSSATINSLTDVANATNEHVLTKDTATGNAIFKAPQGGSLTDSGTTVYLTNTTDELVIGGTTPLSSAKVSIDGDADQIQAVIQGHSTQTSNILEVQKSDGTVNFSVSNTAGAVVGGSSALLTPSSGNIGVTGTDSTKILAFALSGATGSKTATLTSSHTDNRTITLPDATDTLVGKATTDTLTNKTLTIPVLDGTPASAGAIGYDTTQKLQTAYGGASAVAGFVARTIATGVGTESKTDSTASDQDFTSMFTFPAGSIYTGKVYRVSVLTEQVNGTSANTLIYYLKLGSTKVFTTAANDAGNGFTQSNVFTFYIFGRAASGASANVSTAAALIPQTTVNTNRVNQPVALATNGTLTVSLGVTWSGTGSTETVEQQGFIIEELA